MLYKKLKIQNFSELDFKRIWFEVYCNPLEPIRTFDNIIVKFYEDMFDHAFYESENHKIGDKSILSLNRLEKMLWIKDTLQDTTSILKVGWDKNSQTYTESRRVALVKNN